MQLVYALLYLFFILVFQSEGVHRLQYIPEKRFHIYLFFINKLNTIRIREICKKLLSIVEFNGQLLIYGLADVFYFFIDGLCQ